jgi:hypothetical protein
MRYFAAHESRIGQKFINELEQVRKSDFQVVIFILFRHMMMLVYLAAVPLVIHRQKDEDAKW